MSAEQRPFLTAEWRQVVLVNYEVPPNVLQPLVPRGTELDAHRGRTFVSLVGFRFRNTRVLGWRIPLHEHFDEVNLRFYVRREVAGELRRAVTFVREIVPRRAIAFIARALYNEPYVRMPMRSEVRQSGAQPSLHVRYEWRRRGQPHAMEIAAGGESALPEPQSDAEFITEHYWGYTRQADGGTIEYRVEHPTWRVRTATTVAVTGDMIALYGDELGPMLTGRPVSAFLADGSVVTVSRPLRIA